MRAVPILAVQVGAGTVDLRPAGAEGGVLFVSCTGRNTSVTPPGGWPSKLIPMLWTRDLEAGDWSTLFGGPMAGVTDWSFTVSGSDEMVFAGVWVPDAKRVTGFGIAHDTQQPTPVFDVQGEAVVVEGYNSANKPTLARLVHPMGCLTGDRYGNNPNYTRTYVSYAPKGSQGRYGGHAVESGWGSQVDYVYTAVLQ